MSATWELQKTIYTILNTGLTVPVFSLGATPDNQSGVYVVIGEDTATPHDADLQTGFDITLMIHVWDKNPLSKGLKVAKEEAGNIYNLLNRSNINVTGYTVLDCVSEFERSTIESDGITGHSIQRFRVLMTTN